LSPIELDSRTVLRERANGPAVVRKRARHGSGETKTVKSVRQVANAVAEAMAPEAKGERMTVLQEHLNAWSMIFPAVLCWWWIHEHDHLEMDDEHDVLVVVMMVSTCLHLPFSFVYHLWCATYPDKERVKGNVLRILDQMFIHVACVGYALSLSGSGIYMGVVSAHNLFAIYRLWQPNSKPSERKTNIFLGAVLYILPIMLWHGTYQFLYCIVSFIISVYPFGFRIFGGYSQTVFHLLCIPYQWALLESIAPGFSGDQAIMTFFSDLGI